MKSLCAGCHFSWRRSTEYPLRRRLFVHDGDRGGCLTSHRAATAAEGQVLSKKFYIVVFLYCAGIFLLSSDPAPPAPAELIPGQDKVFHMVLYAGLGALVGTGLRQKGSGSPTFQAVFPIIFAGIYGLSDEIHQIFVPNRSCDIFDILADILGAGLFQAAYYAWSRRKMRSRV